MLTTAAAAAIAAPRPQGTARCSQTRVRDRWRRKRDQHRRDRVRRCGLLIGSADVRVDRRENLAKVVIALSTDAPHASETARKRGSQPADRYTGVRSEGSECGALGRCQKPAYSLGELW
jgi:hypothetical protein